MRYIYVERKKSSFFRSYSTPFCSLPPPPWWLRCIPQPPPKAPPCSRRGLVGGPSPSLPWRPLRPRRRRPPESRRRRPGGGRPGGRGRRPCEGKLIRLGKKIPCLLGTSSFLARRLLLRPPLSCPSWPLPGGASRGRSCARGGPRCRPGPAAIISRMHITKIGQQLSFSPASR